MPDDIRRLLPDEVIDKLLAGAKNENEPQERTPSQSPAGSLSVVKLAGGLAASGAT